MQACQQQQDLGYLAKNDRGYRQLSMQTYGNSVRWPPEVFCYCLSLRLHTISLQTDSDTSVSSHG
jgi:hypothetical protein